VSSTIPLITFSVEHQLNLLNTQKASGPDYILAFVLYHCATEIALILTVIFSQSLNTAEIPSNWLRANVVPIFKKEDDMITLTINPSH